MLGGQIGRYSARNQIGFFWKNSNSNKRQEEILNLQQLA
jgi:hypothetical protein